MSFLEEDNPPFYYSAFGAILCVVMLCLWTSAWTVKYGLCWPNLSGVAVPVAGDCGLRREPRTGGGDGMWDAIKAAIESNGRTVRFIVIIAVLAVAAWLISAH